MDDSSEDQRLPHRWAAGGSVAAAAARGVEVLGPAVSTALPCFLRAPCHSVEALLPTSPSCGPPTCSALLPYTPARPPRRLDPNQPCPAAVLHSLGVRVWALDADAYADGDPRLAAIRKARGYSYEDCVTITPEALPGYEDKIRSFYQEHLHTDEEIRYILDGSGERRGRRGGGRWGRGGEEGGAAWRGPRLGSRGCASRGHHPASVV